MCTTVEKKYSEKMNTNSCNGKTKEQHKTKLTDIESAEIENPVPFFLFP